MADANILPVAKPWGGGPRPKGVVEGPKTCTTPEGVGPSVSGFAAATSPSLRDWEDLRNVRLPSQAAIDLQVVSGVYL